MSISHQLRCSLFTSITSSSPGFCNIFNIKKLRGQKMWKLFPTGAVDLKAKKISVLDKILLECSTASSIQPRQFTIRQHYHAALLSTSGRIHCQFPSIDCVVPCSPQQHYPLGLNHYCLRTWTGRLNFTRIDRLVLPRSGRVCSFQSVLSTINLCSCV